MAITYLVGDATAPDDPGPGVIAHVCNDSGGWGKGFVLAISRRWPEPEAAYRRWARTGQEFGLGMVQIVKVEDHLSVANMVAQHGYVTGANPVAVRYDALAQCLSKLAGRMEEGTLIHMPRIGCGLAGGNWEQIEPLLEEHIAGLVSGYTTCLRDNTLAASCSIPVLEPGFGRASSGIPLCAGAHVAMLIVKCHPGSCGQCDGCDPCAGLPPLHLAAPRTASPAEPGARICPASSLAEAPSPAEARASQEAH